MEAVRAAATTPGTGQPSVAEMRQLRRAAREFEALFLHQMLAQMRKASVAGATALGGGGQGLYRDMMDDELARAMARGGGIGLADMLVRHLTQPGGRKNLSSSPTTRPIGEGVGQAVSEGETR
jgi:flagellar protein FlgJ